MRRAINKSATAILARGRRVAGCSHHWIIELAIGPLSKGVCKLCGAEREFRNQLRWEEVAPVREPGFTSRQGKGERRPAEDKRNVGLGDGKGPRKWPEAAAAI